MTVSVHREATASESGTGEDGGFVLLEAVIAIMLIMVVMTAVTSFFVVTVKVNREQQNAEVAAQIATSGMALVHSVRGPALTSGRDLASSTTQWNALTSTVATYLTGSVEAWDPNAAAGSGPTATLPTTPQDTTVRGLTYHMSWYIGSCWQPAAGGACGSTSTAGAVPLYRVVVAVTWTDAACANALCTYADATLASSVATDPVFNPGGGAVAPASPVGPLGGTPAPIPGTVEAEAYDLGGQGVGYSVTSVNGSSGYGYRNDAVDLENTSDSSGVYDLGWAGGGQWQKYTVNAAYAGAYTIAFRVAAPSAVTDAFHLANAAGTNLTGNVNLPATGSYSTWSTVTVAATVTLPVGVQTLTLAQDHGGWSLNYIVFGATEVPYSSTATPIPGTVEAENYDYGGQGLGYNLSSPYLTTNYRIDGADVGTTSDSSGYNIGWTSGGQWLRYTVNAATAGTYTVTFRVAGQSAVTDAFHLANAGGTNLSGNVNLPGTGGWQTWGTVTATVTVPAGIQTLTLVEDNGGWNLNYMTFALINGPYQGTAPTIPGTVQAEAYDTGGEGLGYHVASVGNGFGYRTDSVDIEGCNEGGYDVGWTAAGNWMRYSVNVAAPGTYSVGLRVSSISGVTDGFHLADANGTNLTGNINVPATGAWQTFTTTTASVYLPAGQQVLTLVQDHPNWDINYLTFTTVEGPYGGTAAAVPGTVQAENYDTGGPGLGYNLSSVNGGGYRADSADIGTNTDTSGYNIGWTSAGQWQRYTVNVVTARTYTITVRFAAPSAVTDAFHLANSGGTNLSGNINLPASGSFSTWTTATATIPLPAGVQTLTLAQDHSGWNLNYLTFS